MSLTVSAENTPNPATLKFQFSERLGDNTQEFTTPQDAELSPLAAKIFGFPWTSSVYVGPDFVTVTKQDWVDWEVLRDPLAGLIEEHLASGLPLWSEFTPSNEFDGNDSAEVKEIKNILAREIRPVVALDGGDIVFAKFEDGILSLQMKGACAGCPSSTATLKDGIEVRMKELMPQIREVVSI